VPEKNHHQKDQQQEYYVRDISSAHGSPRVPASAEASRSNRNVKKIVNNGPNFSIFEAQRMITVSPVTFIDELVKKSELENPSG
jgi:hypothetical protein